MVYDQKLNNKNIKKISAIILTLFFCFSFFVFPGTLQAQTAMTEKKLETKFVPLNPIDSLSVKIPGLDKLSQQYTASCGLSNQATQCSLPYIAIYIQAIFGYAMGIIGILAAICIMVGGVIYITSAGNATRIATAKSWIGGSVAGLVIGLSSYVLLVQVNPDLVGLKSIKIGIVERDEDTTEPVSIGSVDENGWVAIPSDPNIMDQTGGQKITVTMANKLLSANKCMQTAGYKMRVSSASRSLELQKSLYTKNCGGATTCVASSKCTTQTCCPFKENARCPHTTGAAIDIWGFDPKSTLSGNKSKAAQTTLQNCKEGANFCLLATECWHFEFPQISNSCGGGNNFKGSNCTALSK